MITVPQGGSVAGRSADIRGLDQQPDMGGFISQVGSAVAQKMGQIREQQRTVVVEKTKLDMTKEQGEAYQRVAQLTDPAEIETAWAAEQAALRKKYVNGKDAAGNPLLTPEEADALTLTFDGLAVKHGFALGERTVKLTESQQAAAWSAARLDIVNTAATADPDTMAALVEYGEAAIERLPGLMPDQKQAQKEAFRAEVTNARAITALDQDPVGFIAAAAAGTYDPLGGERKAQLMVTAQAEADRRAAAATKQAEADAAARTSALSKRFGEIAGMESKWLKTTDRDYVMNAPAELQAVPGWAEARASIQLNDELPQIDTMTVAELDAQIAAETGKTYTYDWEAKRLDVLKTKRDKLATEAATDPKAAAIARGVIAPKGSLEFDPSDPTSFAAGVAEAVSHADYLKGKGFATGSAIFTKDQAAPLKEVLAPANDAAPKVAMLGAIIAGTNGNVAPVLGALEADEVTRRTAKVLALTGDTGLATSILRGNQRLQDGQKTVIPPSLKDQVMMFDAMTGGVFDDAPQLKAEIMEATLALYADGARSIDGETQSTDGYVADGAAYSLYQQSLQRLLGAQPDNNGALTLGGLQEVNGQLTVLPVGVPVQAVEAAWESVTSRLEGRMAGGAGRGGAGAGATRTDADYSAFAGASIYPGSLPDLGADPAARMATLSLKRIGETDVYELVYEQGGRLIKVPEQGSNGPYRFRLTDLVRGHTP